MKSTQLIACVLRGICALAVGACLLTPVVAVAQEAKPAAEKAEAALPLARVVMFNSGVGYFEHQGQVTGDAKIDLQFRVDDINDLLKSMILEDRGGGTISTVTYGSRDPITKTLQTFAIDLTENPTLGAILDQVRGEQLQVDAPNPITGVLLGVEKRKKEVGKDETVVEEEFLNLLTDAGMRSVPMQSISRIKLVNEKLDAELRQALAVLAGAHNTDKKTVTLDLLGNGQRPVRVGYVQSTPIWKTSYRLVLDDKKPPFLQGWAIVENTTEGDWNDVALTLVSGRPISYTMDLYEPLYVTRPTERLNLFASLQAQRYGQDMDKPDGGIAAGATDDRSGKLAARQRSMLSRSSRAQAEALAEPQAPAAGAPPADAPTPEESSNFAYIASQPSAAAGEVGELFQYKIDAPVTLARQKSAMLPIVNEHVKGEKVSIYNPAVQPKHPLNGLRLVNSTDLHLMQGPITVFDGGAYAGDAIIEDISPHSERLISYALDLQTEVAPEGKGHPEQLVSVKIAKGTMHVARKLTREQIYAVKNSDDKAKTVLIEQPFDPSWKLVVPKEPAERTRDRYRFAVQAEPGKVAKLSVQEEQVISQQLALTNLDDGAILYFSNAKEVSPQVKAALQEVIKRKQAIEQVTQERDRLSQQVNTITEEQNRIRQNMAQLDRNTDLYKRYVEKFGAQEDSVEKIRTQVDRLNADEAQLRRALDDYLLGLDIA
ncbi:MAG: hypothetical protein AB7O59_03590 [Pirellulales bacterium]